MSEIDLETGLPQLEEPYYWRVEHGYSGFWEAGSAPPKSQLIVMVVEDVESVSPPGQRTLRQWLGGDVVEPQRSVTRKIITSGATEDLTPAGVLKRAQEVLEAWEKKVAEQARIDQLVGTYPPKKLEVGE